MTALATTPTLSPRPPVGIPAPRRSTLTLLRGDLREQPGKQAQPENPTPGLPKSRDAQATQLMDEFRRTRSREVFDALVGLTREQLLARVQTRVRFSNPQLDAEELLQDAYINIYCYPDRFDASRPGAFRAWATTIVDNSVRRSMRRMRSGPEISLRGSELLEQEPDELARGPETLALRSEEYEQLAGAWRIFLALYLRAYQGLSERERFVLQMVEVKGMRYAELAKLVGIRPEALKMVVFRARRRIAARIGELL